MLREKQETTKALNTKISEMKENIQDLKNENSGVLLKKEEVIKTLSNRLSEMEKTILELKNGN